MGPPPAMAVAVFSLFVRRLPERRNYLLACGVDDVLAFLETLRFDEAALAYLDSLGRFSTRFLRYLAELRFTGDVYAVPEGTPKNRRKNSSSRLHEGLVSSGPLRAWSNTQRPGTAWPPGPGRPSSHVDRR